MRASPPSSTSALAASACLIVLLGSAALVSASHDAGAVPVPSCVLLFRRANVALVLSDSVDSNLLLARGQEFFINLSAPPNHFLINSSVNHHHELC